MEPPIARAYWWSAEELHPLPKPEPSCPNPYLVPAPCRFHPVRLEDVPDFWDEVIPSEGEEVNWCVPGTKLLGYPMWNCDRNYPICPHCESEMRLLMTANSREVDPADGIWYERYSPEVARSGSGIGFRPTGINVLDSGRVFLFYCENCPGNTIATQMK